jgi:ATP-dependent Clp protease ATP-binding subunit ClpC
MNEVQEKLNNEAQRAIWIAKSISAENHMLVLYPEAFAIAIIGYGPNIVTRILAQFQVDAPKIVQHLRAVLSLRKREEISVFQTKVVLSPEMFHLMKIAVDWRNKMGSTMVGVHHIMLSLLKLNDSVKEALEPHGFNLTSFEGAVKNILITKTKTKGRTLAEPSQDDFTISHSGAGIKTPRSTTAQTGVKKTRNVLEAFCIDLTIRAQQGDLDVVIGREKEIDRVITTLCRKKKNNPLLVGEHGVGKTAIVEGLAQRIVAGAVPDSIRSKRVYSLDLASMVAGTTYRGQFEERMKAVLAAINENPDAIIFIDEVHTMIGAGGAIGALDAADMLKPSLARGELHCIGATTEMEYKKYFKKDGALDRRFQRIRISEPTSEETLEMLKGLRPGFEAHHNCLISDDILEAAVQYSGRYIAERHFPDKAIDVIDEVCARFSKSSDVKFSITLEQVAQVISDQAGVPATSVKPSDLDRLDEIEKHLHSVIIGQDNAINTLMQAVQSSYAGIRNPERPMGCFLFAGPSGAGKTYTAKEFAKKLFLSPNSYIQINMTEFSEKFQSSKLLGSPPGYVGHGDRNQLADKVMQNPYCFVLFDEIDKADPEVMKILLPIMSEGKLTDAEGTEINFRNTFIGMTTNIGFGEYDKQGSMGFAEVGAAKSQIAKDRIVDLCRKQFSPEFVNRIDEVVLFDHLKDDDLVKILKLELDKLANRVGDSFSFESDEDFLSQFVQMSKRHHGINGFRINRAIQTDIQPVLTQAILQSKERRLPKRIKLKIRNGKVVV